MPELPEVETIRQDLRKKILDKKITEIEILHKKTVRNKHEVFLATLKNNKIREIDRIGKLIIFELQKGGFLLTHLRMTGQLIHKKNNKITAGGHSLPRGEAFGGETKTDLNLPNKHTRVIFSFEDGSKLYFNDLRLFGFMHIVNEKEKEKIKSDFGIEPMTKNFTFDNFKKIFENKKISLKNLLLNQKIISGLGNIYVDEVCHDCGVRPMRSSAKVTLDEIKKMHKSIEKILRKAVEQRGTTFNNYTDADGKKGNFIKFLKVYGRGGQACKKCKAVLKKTKVNGRGTVFCEECQK